MILPYAFNTEVIAYQNCIHLPSSNSKYLCQSTVYNTLNSNKKNSVLTTFLYKMKPRTFIFQPSPLCEIQGPCFCFCLIDRT